MESDNNATENTNTAPQEKNTATPAAANPHTEEKPAIARIAAVSSHAEESAASTTVTPQPAGEISAATIARMMGLATATDMKLLISKIDLVLGRVNAMTARMEKVAAAIGQVPTGSDLERIDVQIGSLRTIIKESMGTGKADFEKEKTAKSVKLSQNAAAAAVPEK